MMQQKEQPRATSFLLVMSWIYILFALGMIGLAIYQLTNADVQRTFRIAAESVYLFLGGLLGIVAGIFGLVSKDLKRCRIIGLIILAIAAIPLVINLIAGDTFQLYWKNLAAIVLPFLYLLASLFKRSVKKPFAAPVAQTPQPDLSQYAASAKKPAAAPETQAVIPPESQTQTPTETETPADQQP